MSADSDKVLPIGPLLSAEGHLAIGSLAGFAEDGAPLVTVSGSGDPVGASTLVQFVDTPEERLRLCGADVLLYVQSGRGGRVVLLGLLHEQLFVDPGGAAPAIAAEGSRNVQVDLDGESLTLSAERELTLKCGKSTIVLKKDGTLVLKGVNISSRASRANKIKGASVKLN